LKSCSCVPVIGVLPVAAILCGPSFAVAGERTSRIDFSNVSILQSSVPVSRPMLFQRDPSNDRDSLWNGMLIGAGIGAAVGMLIAPPAFCGGQHDTECATIVRAAIGLPAIAGGIGLGALIDGLQSRRGNPVRSVQVNWKF
jgi:hypothetical protein